MAKEKKHLPGVQSERLKRARPGRNVKPSIARMTPEEQQRRFIEAAREAGCSEVEADFDASLTRIVKPKS